MIDDTKKFAFIDLRSIGKSFESISNEINISKPTLIKWSKELELEIHNVKALRMDEMREKYLISKEHKVSVLKELINKAEEELASRSYSDLSTDKLVHLYNDLIDKLSGELIIELKEESSYDPLKYRHIESRSI
jgi:hypothetical protein